MTEAERFLREKLNPPQNGAMCSSTIQRTMAKGCESDRGWGVLRSPVFSEHRTFWFVGFLLLLFLANLLVAVAGGLPRMLDHYPDDDDIFALCFLMVTPISFWVPALYLFYWAFGWRTLQVIGWISSIWMVFVQMFHIFILFNLRYADPTDIVVGIVVAILGFMGVAAIIRNLIVQKKREENSVEHAGKLLTPSKLLKVKYACPFCKKTVRSFVTAASSGTAKCPACGNEIAVSELATSVKEPIPAQLARVVFYILGILAIGFGVSKFLSGRFSCNLAFMLGELIGAIVIPALYYSIAHGIKQGKMWVRIFLLTVSILTIVGWVVFRAGLVAIITSGFMTVLPTTLIFLPRCNDWFSFKRFCRKSVRAKPST